MPRRKNADLFDEKTMKKAVFKVVKKGFTIRGVARSLNLSYATLRKYVAKYNSTEKKNRKSIRFFPNYEVNQVYSKELENILEKYLIIARKLHYGLTSETIKRMSYDLAVKNNLKVPKSWKESRMAGKHWLYGFLKRHPLIFDILSWSRKFRPPIKKQFNTTLEIAHPCVEEITVSEKDIEKYIESDVEDLRPPSGESDVEDSRQLYIESVVEDSTPAVVASVVDESGPEFLKSVTGDSKPAKSKPVIIIPIKKKRKL